MLSGMLYCSLSICSGDADWLGFSVVSGLDATITFSDALGDLELEIYSASTLAWVDGSYSGTDDENVFVTGLSSGTYWARIIPAAGMENPSYCFVVNTF